MSIKKKNKIFIAGHKGMVGSSLLRLLKKKNYSNIITVDKKKLDLKNQKKVDVFFKKNKIDIVYQCAAKVGGIYANKSFPADFITENILIQSNIILAAFKYKVKKIIFLGSSCVYPKILHRKIKETDLLTGQLESTNEPYAIAKISGIKMCESFNKQYKTDFRCLMPTNLYGPGDNYHPRNSHVMAALIRKFYMAKKKSTNVKIWGTGEPLREFLYVDDLAEAMLFLTKISKNKFQKETSNQYYLVNIGYGKDFTIKEIAEKLSKIFNFNGKIFYDRTKPDGVKRKYLDCRLINKLGWKPKYKINEVLKKYINTLKDENFL
jgi:GDP-L-fucose synthase